LVARSSTSGEKVFSFDIMLGVVGAIAGGWVFSLVGASGVTGLNVYSLLVAVAGAILVLVLYHAIQRAAHHG
jgi:uncharacterized membrane protein YeaQ/YmgE (transglycosylase-associated protein family)